MNDLSTLIPTNTVLHFIRSYRRLEQAHLEDGFAELACVSADSNEEEQKRLRKHFRDHWYSKERAFGRFYLNLPHHRQIYLLRQWDIRDYEDDTYLWECRRDGRFALMGSPPTTARQLHGLVLYFENHGIDLQPSPDATLPVVPDVFEKRFGNSANWGDYILALPEPEPVLIQLLGLSSR